MRAIGKLIDEATGPLRNPTRAGPLVGKVARDAWQSAASQQHLYRFSTPTRETAAVLDLMMEWVREAQRPDGGIPAYYSLNTGYAPSYPETTGYLIPTLYDYADLSGREEYRDMAVRAADWLLTLQMPDGAFPGGFANTPPAPSVFNTGQILQGLVRAAELRGDERIRDAAVRTGDWLVRVQQPDGSWSGPTYQGRSHTYYTMVAWSLSLLWRYTGDRRYFEAARANAEWTIAHRRERGWFDGINLKGHPIYLHFIAYLLQGLVETGVILGLPDIVDAAREGSWRLLRMWELRKWLPGAFRPIWKSDARYACLTGNAQMSCVWLRLYQVDGDLRYLNAALKQNEFLKERIPVSGSRGIRGGVAGSYPTWGRYQPFRFINWGSKFMADALMDAERQVAAVGSC